MITQIISVNRKKYAVGLFWQPASTTVPARNYARSLSHSIDKKLNLYTEYRAMIGLGARKFGHKSGMSSAAAEIVDAFPEYSSFLAVFFTGRVYYLVAVRNGVILQDTIFERAEDARAQYAKLSEIPDWGALIAPANWGMPRSIERDISELITGRAHAVLRSISRFRALVFSGALLVLFAIMMMTMFRGPVSQMISPRPKISKINPELAAEYKRQIEEKNKQLDEQFDIQKNIPEPLNVPYDNLPDVAARADVCYRAIGFLMQPVAGWSQVDVTCGEKYVSANFKRTFGTLGGFYEVADSLMPAALVFETSENELVVRATLPTLDTHASQDERDAETIVRDVTTLFQSIDVPVETNVVVDVLSNGVDTVTLNVVEIAASSKLTPQQFMKIFADFGGVYMTGCTWNSSNRTWNYEVIIYAK